ncbi:Whole genome shotgun sequence [Vibrio parahaemolyticus]
MNTTQCVRTNFNQIGIEQQLANVMPIKYQLKFNRLYVLPTNSRDKKTG